MIFNNFKRSNNIEQHQTFACNNSCQFSSNFLQMNLINDRLLRRTQRSRFLQPPSCAMIRHHSLPGAPPPAGGSPRATIPPPLQGFLSSNKKLIYLKFIKGQQNQTLKQHRTISNLFMVRTTSNNPD